jgi:hypothetical protein
MLEKSDRAVGAMIVVFAATQYIGRFGVGKGIKLLCHFM